MTNFRMTKEIRMPNADAETGRPDSDFVISHSLVISHWSLVIGLLLACYCVAVPGAGLPTLEHWDADRGLPEDTVFSITQTRDGYLWLGTLDGLVRFDGIGHSTGAGRTQFAVFKEDNTPGLTSSRIVKLFADSRENLWIGTETEGVVVVDQSGNTTSFNIGRGSREGALRAACEDATGAVWLYTADGQLCRIKDKKMDGPWYWDEGRPSNCRSLVADETGLLWIGTDLSLAAIDPKAVKGDKPPVPVKRESPVGRLDFLLSSRSGGYWRMANGRIQKWKKGRIEDWGGYPWQNQAIITTACEDLEGNLIVGTYKIGAEQPGAEQSGVFWFDAHHKYTRIPVSHDSIWCVLVDREGCLWVGTNGRGLDRVKWPPFDVLEGTKNFVVQSVCEDRRGGLWIGYNGERVDHWTGGVLQHTNLSWIGSPLAIRSVFVDRETNVWAGTFSAYGGGLFRLVTNGFRPAQGSDMLDRQISALYQDRNGLLWVGTQQGLGRFDGRSWNTFTSAYGAAANAVRAIADDAEGNFWMGTDGGGLLRIRQDQISVFRATNGLPSDHVSALQPDDNGVLWVGTSLGLARFAQNKWTSYTTSEGLASGSVYYLADDNLGYLWIGSSAGLVRVSKKLLNDFAQGLTNWIQARAFGKPDGLPTGECTSGSQPAACRSSDGKLWFPTISGLATVNPAELRLNTNPPPVVIESVFVEEQPQTSNSLRARLPDSIMIPAGKERLEIDYTSLNLAAPERARFQYRMTPFETKWHDAKNVRAAYYPKLPPGPYRFEVKACNEDGVWSTSPASLAFIVQPPFWRTWWFLTVATICLLGIIVGSVHYVSTQKLIRQLEGMRQQEALEQERSRIARDLHDQLGANLTQVALLGELAESDKDSPQEVEAHARQISQTARETTRALDEIVWTVNPSNDTLDGLINYLCKYAQEYFALAGLRYRLEVPPQLPNASISPEVRHNVFLAAKEAVNNVVKHAQAGSAWLRLRLEPHRFTIEVEDDGRGLAASGQKTGRNGLQNMRKRMEDIGGEFKIGSGAEKGTLVSLSAPLSNNNK
jgi:signal transduction histidine kinase/ligand-binding sensor domain-containing protein